MKAYAYITAADRLLVFREPSYPEAGIQIPGGTVEVGELPQMAVLREAREETGLTNLQLHCYLGSRIENTGARGHEVRVQHHFFHLLCPGNPPDTWVHYEHSPSTGETEPIELAYYWVDWPTRTPHRAAHRETLLATRQWHS